MVNTTHASREELMKLLGAESDSEQTHRIGQHLKACTSCREQLDALAANSDMWQMAPQVLNRHHSSNVFVGSQGEETKFHASAPQAGDVEESWQYPLEGILDSPKHPEMLGRIGNYEIECEIGRGGMGIVLKAHDSVLNRPLAIKILAPHLASHGTARKRFAQEAISAAGVIHPNVIAIHGVENKGKTPYIVMPFVPGHSLQSLVEQQGPLFEIEITRIGLQISAGLAAAHSQNLVHRDIKPANILVEANVNRVLITDFGLAQAENDASMTRTGWLAGTPNYMSPEQTRGERPDHRSDLFSLGSTLYFLATGRLPFRAETPLGVLSRIQNDEPTPVRQANNQISETLSDVILKLLKKDPAERFQTSAELHEFLEKHVAYLHQPDTSKPPQLIPKTRMGLATATKLLVGTMFVLAILLCTLVYSGVFANPWSDAMLSNQSVNKSEESPSVSLLRHNNQPIPSDDGAGDTNVLLDKDIDEILDDAKTAARANRFEESEKLCRRVLKIDPQNDDAATNLGYALHMQGKLDEALPWHERAAASEDFKALGNYNLCCFYSLRGDSDKAFAYLDKAIYAGLPEILQEDELEEDPDLQNIRDDRRYAKAIGHFDSHSSRIVLWNDDNLVKIRTGNDPGVLARMHNVDEISGEWKGRLKKGGQVELKVTRVLEDSNFSWGYMSDFEVKEFEPSLGEDLTEFRLKRKYGDIQFKGAFAGTRGNGKFEFEGSNSFREWLKEQGIKDAPDALLFRFFFSGKSESKIVANLQELQKLDIDEQTLRALMVDGVNAELVREYQEAELAPKDHVQFIIWRVNPELIQKYNLAKLSLEKHKVFINARVPASLLVDYNKAGFSLEDHKNFISARVPASLLKQYQAAELDPNKHQHFVHARVSPSLLQKYQKAGFELKTHGKFINWRVEPRMLKAYVDAGLSINDYSKYINKRVPAKLIKSYTDAGFDLQTYGRFVEDRVEVKLLKSYRSAELPLKDYEQLIQQRIPARLIKDYLEADFDPHEFKDVLNARIDVKLLKKYQAAGLDIEIHLDFIKDRVEPAKVLRYLKRRSKKGN